MKTIDDRTITETIFGRSIPYLYHSATDIWVFFHYLLFACKRSLLSFSGFHAKKDWKQHFPRRSAAIVLIDTIKSIMIVLLFCALLAYFVFRNGLLSDILLIFPIFIGILFTVKSIVRPVMFFEGLDHLIRYASGAEDGSAQPSASSKLELEDFKMRKPLPVTNARMHSLVSKLSEEADTVGVSIWELSRQRRVAAHGKTSPESEVAAQSTYQSLIDYLKH